MLKIVVLTVLVNINVICLADDLTEINAINSTLQPSVAPGIDLYWCFIYLLLFIFVLMNKKNHLIKQEMGY